MSKRSELGLQLITTFVIYYIIIRYTTALILRCVYKMSVDCERSRIELPKLAHLRTFNEEKN